MPNIPALKLENTSFRCSICMRSDDVSAADTAPDSEAIAPASNMLAGPDIEGGERGERREWLEDSSGGRR